MRKMKKKQHYLLSIICLLLTACGASYTHHEGILKAESLLAEHPDSAYLLLADIPRPEQMSKPDYAAWCLHYTHAQYKLYRDIKSDSLIQVAVDYYANSKLKKQSGTAYYLLGCVSELLQQKEKAMLAYKQASIVLEGTKYYTIAGLASINMGYIYQQDKNYYEAMPCFKKSLRLFRQSGNKKYQISSCQELSNMFLQLDYPFDSILLYSNKALQLSNEINDTLLSYHIRSQQGELFYNKNSRLAIGNLLVGFQHCPELRTRNASFLAYIYAEQKQIDSAAYYLNIANKDSGRNELEVIQNLAGAVVYQNRNDYKQAYQLFQNAYVHQDSMFQQKLKSQLYRIDKQFDLSEKQKENAVLKIANRTKIIWIGLLIILVLIVFLIFQRRNILHKEKQAVMEIRQQKLEYELREKELENSKKQELLLAKLHQRIEMTLRFNKIQLGVLNPKKLEEFMETMTNQVILSKNEWQYYIDETNSLFYNKISDLTNKYTDLTSSDLIVIVLIRLGIDISDSCLLLKSSKETMYVRRKRIKKRLGIDGDLEVWIKQNIL